MGNMERIKLHLTGGDGFGWALDEDLRVMRDALPAHVDLAELKDADVVYAPWWEGLMQCGLPALVGKRVLCGLDNPIFHWITRPRFRAVKDMVGLWVGHSSQALAQAAAVGLPARLVPYGFQPSVFHPANAQQPDRAALRRQLGLPEHAYIIGNFQRDTEGGDLRRLKVQKAPDVFAEVMRVLHGRGLPVHVLLAGPRRHWLRQKLEEYGVPYSYVGRVAAGDDIKLNLLPREELGRLYRAIDLYLLTSRWEGGPYALLEAASTGCKIVSTRVGLAEDLLEPASLCDDLDQMAAVIAADIQDNHLAAAAGIQYRRALDDFTNDGIKPHVAALFAALHEVPVFREPPAAVQSNLPAPPPSSLAGRALRFARRLLLPPRPAGSGVTVSIFREYVKPPYGGGNQFMLALRKELQAMDVRVLNNSVGEHIDGYIFDSLWFDMKLLDKLARLNQPRVVHRIDGPIHLYRGKDKELDDRIFEINRDFATATVVQSLFTWRNILNTGYRPINPVVIRNAPDPAIFNRDGKMPFDPARRIRLISSSWSNNPRKGGDAYSWLDNNLDWNKYEYRFIGNSSASFKAIRRFDAVPSAQLAQHLRECDIYITASQNDPCSNALIEALNCGLPAIYLKSGGHPELVGTGGLGFDDPAEIPALLERLTAHYAGFQACIPTHSIRQVAENYLACITGE